MAMKGKALRSRGFISWLEAVDYMVLSWIFRCVVSGWKEVF